MALRALGFEPSKEELKQLIGNFDKEKTGKIDFHEFLDIMITKMVSGCSVTIRAKKTAQLSWKMLLSSLTWIKMIKSVLMS